MKAITAAALSGVVFGAGLCLSGMTVPAKIIGFLDFFGSWDPSLLFVMIGAIGVHLPLRLWIQRQQHPRYADSFSAPPPPRIDARLIGGAAIFGVGWGLSGYCPGPAIVSAALTWRALAALVCMVIGIALHDWRKSSRSGSVLGARSCASLCHISRHGNC
jgi:uncharacterized membrane protein YedE/YeeE